MGAVLGNSFSLHCGGQGRCLIIFMQVVVIHLMFRFKWARAPELRFHTLTSPKQSLALPSSFSSFLPKQITSTRGYPSTLFHWSLRSLKILITSLTFLVVLFRNIRKNNNRENIGEPNFPTEHKTWRGKSPRYCYRFRLNLSIFIHPLSPNLKMILNPCFDICRIPEQERAGPPLTILSGTYISISTAVHHVDKQTCSSTSN